MGAGLQRWWSTGSYESACAEYDRKLRLRNMERGMFSWTWDQMRAGLTPEEVGKLFPHPRASEGFTLICVQHGIYGRLDRGDRCGVCTQRQNEQVLGEWHIEPWLESNVIPNLDIWQREQLDGWENRIATSPLVPEGTAYAFRVEDFRGGADLDPERPLLQFSKVTAPDEISEPVSIDCGDRETAQAIIDMMNAPLTRDQERRADRLRKILIASTPADRSAASRFYEDLAIFGEGKVKLTWDTEAVNPNKEMAVAKHPNGVVVGEKFVEQMQRLMNADAYSDEQFEQRVTALLSAETKKQDVDDLLDLAEMAWGVIASVGHKLGGWEGQHPEWVETAEKWRDQFHEALAEHLPTRSSVALKTALNAAPSISARVAIANDAIAAGRVTPAEYMKLLDSGDVSPLLPTARTLEKRKGISRLLEQPGQLFQFADAPLGRDLSGGPDELRGHKAEQFIIDEGAPLRAGEPGRAGDQLRKCHGCDKELKVDHFNLSIAPHASVGVFGDDEDLYICDACAPDVLKAVRRVRDGKMPARSEPHDIDLIADDARGDEK